MNLVAMDDIVNGPVAVNYYSCPGQEWEDLDFDDAMNFGKLLHHQYDVDSVELNYLMSSAEIEHILFNRNVNEIN